MRSDDDARPGQNSNYSSRNKPLTLYSSPFDPSSPHPSSPSTVAAIDLGTTGCRAVVLASDGRLLAEVYEEYESIYLPDGGVEQDANLWWTLSAECLREAVAKARVEPQGISAVGLSTQGHSWVLIDEQMRPIANALCWLDTRASKLAAEIPGPGFTESDIAAIAGKLPGPWHLLPQLLYLRKRNPMAVEAARWYATILDYLTARLTGNCVTEPTMAACSLLLDIRTNGWSQSLLERFDVPPAKLPLIVPSGSIVGSVTEEAAAETGLAAGTPVVIGGQDQKCAAFGAGIAPGTATISLGTATAVSVLCDKPAFDFRFKIPCFPYFGKRRWVFEAPLATTGGALRWLRDALRGPTSTSSAGITYERLSELAAASPPGANGVTFHPHLAGAAAPRWQPQERARFLGLSLATTQGDLARAVMEGVAYEIAANVDAVEAMGAEVKRVHLFGGGGKSETWTRILAAALGRALFVFDWAETASLGAAMLAAAAGGLLPDWETAQATFAPSSRQVEASPSLVEAYRQLREGYEAEA